MNHLIEYLDGNLRRLPIEKRREHLDHVFDELMQVPTWETGVGEYFPLVSDSLEKETVSTADWFVSFAASMMDTYGMPEKAKQLREACTVEGLKNHCVEFGETSELRRMAGIMKWHNNEVKGFEEDQNAKYHVAFESLGYDCKSNTHDITGHLLN